MNSTHMRQVIDMLMAGNSSVVYQDKDLFICENFSMIPQAEAMRRPNTISILFCAAGRAQIEHEGTTYAIEAGDILLCSNIEMLADCLFNSDFRYAVLGLSSHYVARLLAGERRLMEQFLYIREHPVLRISEQAKALLPAYALMFDSKIHQKRHPFHKKAVDAMIAMAIYDVLGFYEEIRQEDPELSNYDDPASPNGSAAIFKRFIMLVGEDDCQHRTVAYFADKLCITPKYLSTVCRRESQRTPLQWIHEALTQRIRHLLIHSDKSVKEIAMEMNFPNISFFGKFVRQHLGASPTAIRNNKPAILSTHALLSTPDEED